MVALSAALVNDAMWEGLARRPVEEEAVVAIIRTFFVELTDGVCRTRKSIKNTSPARPNISMISMPR